MADFVLLEYSLEVQNLVIKTHLQALNFDFHEYLHFLTFPLMLN